MGHRHPVEALHGPSAAASVITDIGGTVGAAILYVPESLVGLEMEIRPAGGEWDGTHTAVRERHVGASVIWAAFFGSLPAGRYELRVRAGAGRVLDLEVCGGHVAEVSW
jgi:hypothetical protein